jgi:hypothetical protein
VDETRYVAIYYEQRSSSISDGDELFFLHSLQTGSGVSPASYSAGAGISPVEHRGMGVKLTNDTIW